MKIPKWLLILIGASFLVYVIVRELEFNKLQKKVETKAEKRIEQNIKKYDSLEIKENEERKDRDVIDQDIKELDQQKEKPYGKKDFTNNESVIRAERYFSKRYNHSKDTIKDR